MELQIQDFSHTHQFAVYIKEEDDDDDLCSMCQVRISGPAYRCSGCYFLMHKSCAELPREIEHPFHPQHPLVLLPNPPYKSGNYCCDACRKQREDFTFHCYKCGFDLDIKCASIAPIENETQIQLTTHAHTHQHPLILCTKDQKFDFDCSCCELPLEGSIYVCFQCRLLLHPSCAELPKEIKHLLHPLHPLTLLPRAPYGQFRCCVCRKSRRGFTFQCNECGFYLDVRCASLMIAENEPRIQQQFKHSHPLTVCDNGKKFPLSCYACQLPFNDSIYVCFECRLLLHRSCADLPREFGHPFHPQHPLTLFDEPPYRPFCIIECRACRNSIEGSGYGCVECASEIHIRCALPFPPTIKFEEFHQHPLAFFNIKAKVQYNCNACDMLCTAPYFSCVDCRFNLHVGCIPTLPPTVKHVRHRHPLSLTNSPVRDYPNEDDDAEFYCDACEERRNLFDPTYYCAKCHYVAHVQCATSEVVRLLEEEGSLVCYKLEDTMLDMSSDVIKGNADEVVDKVSMVEEMDQERTKGESNTGANELEKKNASTRKDVLGIAIDNEVMERRDSSMVASKNINENTLLVGLDEEITTLQKETDALEMKLQMLHIEEEALTARLNATRTKLKALEKMRMLKFVGTPLNRSLSF